MEEVCFPAKLKRKDLDEVNDDFCDFSLSSPARKIRRLDVELPPINEEEEMVVFEEPATSQNAFVEQVMRNSPIIPDELSVNLPENEERAIVLYDPMNNTPLLQARSPFSISVNSDFLSEYKNPVLWSNCSNLLKSLEGKTEKEDTKSEQNNGSLAVVPWVPSNSQHQTTPEIEVSEMMDADDLEPVTMDIEDNNKSQEMAVNSVSVNENMNQWQWQQHCMIPQVSHSLSTPIIWSESDRGV